MAHRVPRAQRRRPIRRIGVQSEQRSFIRRVLAPVDVYHHLLTIRWITFFALVTLGFGVFNAGFAFLYLAERGSVANAHDNFADAFFFSVQTMATIGYGDMRPATLYANIIVAIEVLLGLLGFALATGVIFARFSRPTARILFSAVAVVTPYEGQPTFMFRAANQRRNQILEAQVTLMLARNELTQEGEEMRRFHELKVLRTRTPLFSLSWSVLHPIDAESPFHGETPASMQERQVEVIVTMVGFDETLSQQIHARHVYRAVDILFGRRFAEILTFGEDGSQTVDYRRFHDTVAEAAASAAQG